MIGGAAVGPLLLPEIAPENRVENGFAAAAAELPVPAGAAGFPDAASETGLAACRRNAPLSKDEACGPAAAPEGAAEGLDGADLSFARFRALADASPAPAALNISFVTPAADIGLAGRLKSGE